MPSPRNLPNPGIKSRSPELNADSPSAEPQRNPKSTGVGSLSLLQQIFLTQELNQGLLNCKMILYQLHSQGSPAYTEELYKKDLYDSDKHSGMITQLEPDMLE